MVLGLDMSTKKSGYALFNESEILSDFGVWEIPEQVSDWRERILWMGEQVSRICKAYEITEIVCEDVPLMINNPQTLKLLCALQGIVLGVCVSHNITPTFVGVTQWRKQLGMFTGNRKDMKRDEQKKASIEYANKTFGLNLIWKSKTSKFNQDDISDAILVAYSHILKERGNISG